MLKEVAHLLHKNDFDKSLPILNRYSNATIIKKIITYLKSNVERREETGSGI